MAIPITTPTDPHNISDTGHTGDHNTIVNALVTLSTYAPNAGTAAAVVGQVLTANSSTTATWMTPSGGGGGTAFYAYTAGTAYAALTAGTASYSLNSGTASYALRAGTAFASTSALTAGTATFAFASGTASALATTSTPVIVSTSAAPIAGQAMFATSGTAAAWTYNTPWIPEPLASGEALMLRSLANNSNSLTLGDILFSFWTACKTETCNHIDTCTGATGQSGNTYTNVGVYSVVGTVMTLIGSTGNLNGSLWKNTFTTYSGTTTTGFGKTAGQLYAVAALSVGGTAPTLASANSAAFYFDHTPIVMGVLTGQSTLPGTVNTNALTSGPPFGAILQAVVRP
jgi:hypothetical protein